jgi:hypothetical protein
MNKFDGSSSNPPDNLVIFDGVCNLCEASVNFIIRHDKDGVFRFVPSQSELGAALQRQYGVNTAGLDTVVLIHKALTVGSGVLISSLGCCTLIVPIRASANSSREKFHNGETRPVSGGHCRVERPAVAVGRCRR